MPEKEVKLLELMGSSIAEIEALATAEIRKGGTCIGASMVRVIKRESDDDVYYDIPVLIIIR